MHDIVTLLSQPWMTPGLAIGAAVGTAGVIATAYCRWF